MKVNDILQHGDQTLRVLRIRDSNCFCINCDGETMPFWLPKSDLNNSIPGTVPAVSTNLTPQQNQVAHERFTMIAPLLAFLTDDKERTRIMTRIAEDRNISKKTLRRYYKYKAQIKNEE